MSSPLKKHEDRIREALTDPQFQIEQINELFGHFTWSLNIILASGDKHDPKRYWAIDTLYCEEVKQETGRFLVSGIVYWLEGGEGYEFFQAAIDLTEQSFNYVFTFTGKAKSSIPAFVIARDEWESE